MAGTREVIRLAGLYRGIPVHYVSTTAVLAGLGVGGRPRGDRGDAARRTPSCCAWATSRPSTWRRSCCGTRAGRACRWRSTGRWTSSAASRTGAWSTSTEMCALIRFIDRHRPGARHRPAARLRARRRLRGGHPPHLRHRGRDRAHLPPGQPGARPARRPGRPAARPRVPDRRRCRSPTGSASSRGRPPATRRTRWRRSCRCSWTAAARPGSRWRRCTWSTSSRPTRRTNTERALRGQRHRLPAGQRPAAGPQHRPADARRATCPPVGRPLPAACRLAATRTGSRSSSRPDPAGHGAGDAPVAFCADLSPASVLGAYRRGVIPLPAPDEYFRTLNEVRYEDQVAAGTIAVVGDERRRSRTGWPGGRPTRGR